MALVAGAEGDHAVKQLQQHFHAARAGQRLRLQKGLQAGGHADQSLHQTAHGQQAPAVVARHAVGLCAGDRGQLHGQAVQRRQHLGQRGQFAGRGVQRQGKGFAHVADQAPML